MNERLDNDIYDKLHIAGNMLSNSHTSGKPELRQQGLNLLQDTLLKVETFGSLSDTTKTQLVIQKRKFGLELSSEEQEFAENNL